MSVALLDGVILDFGGILYAIDFERLRAALGSLASSNAVDRLAAGVLTPHARAVETEIHGHARFRALLRELLDTDVDDATLDAAWNSILVGELPGAQELARRIAAETRLFLLSNTNAIHHARFRPGCEPLFAHFDALYFSHEVGARKPDPAIFRRVLEEQRLRPDRTVFVDDLRENVEAAKALGMRTVHWPTNHGTERLYDAIAAAASDLRPIS